MKKFGAQYVIYEDSGFLAESVKRVYPLTHKIVFLVGLKPWNTEGDPIIPQQTMRQIMAFPDPEKKFIVVAKYWDTEEAQRNDGITALREAGCDWGMVIDDDEMYHRGQLKNAMEFVSNADESLKAFLVRHQIYWKDRNTIISTLTGAMPCFFHCDGNVYFSKARAVIVCNGNVWTDLPADTLVTHHYSYVRSNKQMLRKIKTFSHASEIMQDWYERVWLQWTPESENLHPSKGSEWTFPRAIPAHQSQYQLEPL